MPSLGIEMPLKCRPSAARPCIAASLLTLKNDYSDWITKSGMKWEEDRAAFVPGICALGGIDIKGQMKLAEGSVLMDGHVSWRAILFRGKIEQAIRDAFNKKCASCAKAKTVN